MNSATPAGEPSQAFGADAPADPPSADAPGFAAPSGIGEAIRALWDDARGALAERLKLLSLEVRLAGITLVQLIVYAVIVAVLVVTAWLGLMGAVVVAFVSAGLHWALALGIGIVINLAVAAVLVKRMIGMVERVGMPKSLRRAGSAAPSAQDTPGVPQH